MDYSGVYKLLIFSLRTSIKVNLLYLFFLFVDVWYFILFNAILYLYFLRVRGEEGKKRRWEGKGGKGRRERWRVLK